EPAVDVTVEAADEGDVVVHAFVVKREPDRDEDRADDQGDGRDRSTEACPTVWTSQLRRGRSRDGRRRFRSEGGHDECLLCVAGVCRRGAGSTPVARATRGSAGEGHAWHVAPGYSTSARTRAATPRRAHN